MKYEIYRNSFDQIPRRLIGKVKTREAADKIIELDRASLDFHQEMVTYGMVSWSVMEIKNGQEPSEESGQ